METTHNLFKTSDSHSIALTSNEKDRAIKVIEELCRQLSAENFSDSECKKWIGALTQSNINRLLYTPISDFIFNLDNSKIGLFFSNLDAVLDFATNNCEEREKNRVLKFWDHANLAHRQKSMFNKNQTALQEQVQKEISHSIVQTEKEMTSQFIGLVGVFTALSFIVFGGINGLEACFSNINNSALVLCILGLIWSFCIMNLLFLFVHLIFKIMHSGKEDTQKDSKGTFQKWHKEAVFCNFVLLSCLAVAFWALYAATYGIGKNVHGWLLKHSTLFFLVGTGVLLAAIIIIGFLLWRFFTSSKAAK